MLTEQQILENKQRYIELLMELGIDITRLLQYLECDRADYFNKAYNSYELAYKGSLCERSLKLFNKLYQLCEHHYPGKYDKKDIIKVALFKDLYRAELYEPYSRNVKNEETNQWESQLGYRYRELRPMFGDVSFSSYMIARKFVELSNDEVVEAMCNSNIGSTNIEIHNIRKNYPLVVLTTIAELEINYLGK